MHVCNRPATTLRYTRPDGWEHSTIPRKERHFRRRLSDEIFVAFHHACDQGDIEIASSLLDVLEFMALRPTAGPGGRERRTQESLVAAYERLWQLQHPKAWDC
jgi:hypothetical protein